MPGNYNAQFESQIASYRSNRRLLIAHNIEFRVIKTDFETIVRAALRQPNSVTFFWPPSTEVGFRNSRTRHQGYAMLEFQTRPDRQAAEEDLRNLVVGGRAVRITRSSRVAFAPSGIQAAAPTAAVAPTSADSASAPAAPAPTVPVPAPIALTAAASTAVATTSVTEETNRRWFHWPGCVEDRSDCGSDCGSDRGSECRCYGEAESLPEIEYLD
ncbi:hypothetical protein A0O28_0032010 [Trichoderma guizhouense]|uniref:RRM domain-containing protein n=1 Tax=Trichoderma guizhouense TaxID=1491466 RepID=A0A1T3CLX4_9HYPO|nr:hypothetical protein A0O28_0032010 [Trichoderma guizhouense]